MLEEVKMFENYLIKKNSWSQMHDQPKMPEQNQTCTDLEFVYVVTK